MPEIQLRPAVPSDLEALVDLETRAMHFPMGHRVREWFRADFPGDHRDRLAVAEHDGRLVAAAALLPLPFVYRGVPLDGAYWEAVATDEAYRRRGLCRRLFKRLTPAMGPDAIFVWGATWLYRRFGYHPALRRYGDLDAHARIVRVADLSASTLDVRPAVPDDAPFLARLRSAADARSVVSAPVPEASWRHDLRPDRTVAGRGETGLNRWQEWRVLEREGRPVGYFMHDPWDLACLMELEIVPGSTTWREATAAAVRATADFPPSPSFPAGEVRATLPDSHPAVAAWPAAFGRASRHPDVAVRIPDAAGFLRKIAPALERTLAASPLAGWTGELTFSRIEDGVRVRFEAGRVREVAPFAGEARAILMPGRFEALALGYRAVARILDEDADCRADEEAEAVLGALFPSGDSLLRPI